MSFKVSTVAAAAAIIIVASAGMAEAHSFKDLHDFRGGKDGGMPFSGLVADGQGNFYGATNTGGHGSCSDGGGCGTVFKIDARGKKKTVYIFKGKKDGSGPVGALAAGPDGSIYGVNEFGGAPCGCGTVFKILPDGTENTLYQFKGSSDGLRPKAGVTLDAAGNIYGTTQQGGGSCSCGTVYKLTPTGTETIIHSFTGGADGLEPWSGVVFDSAGNLYGTTQAGGTGCTFECGTLFKIKPNGNKTVVHNFGVDIEDGGAPMGGLIFDNTGTLWGTTLEGGNSVRGTLYKVTADGTETVAWAFSNFPDGGNPQDGVVFDGTGNLYGTLASNGNDDPGFIFKWSIPDQAESIVYSFPPLPAGRGPIGVLAFDAKGNLYGTTYAGGGNHAPGCDLNGCGTAFEVPKPK
jgi:uncharacterized repeat protein (TIGR03803 family)